MNDLKYYMGLNYPIVIRKYDKYPGWEGYVAEIPDLPGCSASGHTKEETLKNLEDAKIAWISGVLENGREVPEPRGEQEFSGKFLLRMPKVLHRELSLRATSENISLNQYILSLISIGLGNNQALREIKQEIHKIKEDMHTLKEEISTVVDRSESLGQEVLCNIGTGLFAEMPGTSLWSFKLIGTKPSEIPFFPPASQGLGSGLKFGRIISEGFDKKEPSEVAG